MRLSTPLKSALSAAAALALLTACGGGSDDTAETTSAPASSSAGSSAAQETTEAPDAEAAAFCSEAEAAFAELSGLGSTTDPTALLEGFSQASAELSAIEPPAEIADSWGTLTGALAGAVDSVQGVDLTTPEGQQAFAQAFSVLETTGSSAQEEVGAYVDANCDLSTDPASPTS